MKIIIDARTTQDEIKYNGVGRYSRFIIEYLIKDFPNTQFVLLLYNNFSTLDSFINSKPKNLSIVRIGEYKEGRGVDLIKLNLDLFFHISLNKCLKNIDLSDAVFFSPYFWRGLPVNILPTVVTIHDFALPFFNIYSTISPLHNYIRKIHYNNEMKNVLKAKEIIVDAKFTLEDFLGRYPKYNKENIHEVLLGIEEDFGHSDFERLLPQDWMDRKYLIYLGGGVTKNKNSEGVLKGYLAFKEKLISEGNTNYPYLVIAGKNFIDPNSKEAVEFKLLVTQLGLETDVHFTGMYSDFDRWELLKNSFAYIHLSIFEGFGFGVAEAMRAKIPVIVHNGSTYPEVVENGGLLVNGLDSEEVGNAIYKIFTDHNFANQLAKLGYAKSLEYNWHTTAKQTYNILSKALNG